ncbi:cytochrome P450 2D28-like [Diadema antillarum]|uniref:cytochrome P450 2D28-like n=1 Tax=Diadema antillarum TaxID=105358 RepID=UPI003A8606AC
MISDKDSYTVFLIFAAIIIAVIWYVHQASWWRYRLPPGPLGVPVLGMLPYLDPKNPAKSIEVMSKRYGKVFSGNLGNHRAVFLNDYETMKEAFSRSDDSLSDRPRISVFELYSSGNGVACCYIDNHWKTQRRFALRALRNCGMGRHDGFLCKEIVREAGTMLDRWTAKRDPFDPTVDISMMVCNVICKMVFGRRFAYEDEEFREFVHMIDRIFQLSDVAGVVNYLDFMKYVPFSGYSELGEASQRLESGLFTKECAEHRTTFDIDREPRDLIDAYLLEMEKRKQAMARGSNEGLSMGGFTDEQLIHFMADIFAAGTDTTATTIRWTILHCAKFTEVQRKVHEELDRVVGRGRMPTMLDRPNLPYTQALLAESLRHPCPGPFGVPHGAKEDTKILGFDVPKGTVVIGNLYAVLHDPEIFTDPEVFNPDRFLDQNGELIAPLVEKANIQFGIGRRACIGEKLAHTERFMFVTHILHRFTVEAPNGPDSLSIESCGGLARNAAPYKVLLKVR